MAHRTSATVLAPAHHEHGADVEDCYARAGVALAMAGAASAAQSVAVSEEFSNALIAPDPPLDRHPCRSTQNTQLIPT
jgi:hypothetical protein